MIVQFPKFPCQFLEIKLTFPHHPRLLWHFKLTSSRRVSVGAPSAFSKLVIFLQMLWLNCRDLDRHGILSVDPPHQCGKRVWQSWVFQVPVRLPATSTKASQQKMLISVKTRLERIKQDKSFSLTEKPGGCVTGCVCVCVRWGGGNLWAKLSATSMKMKEAPEESQAEPLSPASGLGIQTGHWLAMVTAGVRVQSLGIFQKSL